MHSERSDNVERKRTNTDSVVINESELGPDRWDESDTTAQTEVIIIIVLASLVALNVDGHGDG